MAPLRGLTNIFVHGLFLLLPVLLVLSPMVLAQDPVPEIDWEAGPTVGDLGGIAEIRVPEGYLFTGKEGTQKLLELTNNIPNGEEVGAIVPEGEGDEDQWFIIFEFSDTGYIKDDDKDELDAAALLESIQAGTEEQNELRKEKGWELFHVVGWEKPPYYDSKTNNLTWAIRGRSDGGGDTVNHSTRLLGRRGTMKVDLVVSPEQMASAGPRFDNLLAEFSYLQGHRYSEYITGDKVASYGLTALVAGGAGAAAVKTGLLKKFWKLIVAGAISLGIAAKRLWTRFSGRDSATGSV
jgi:uncharacterized membrane-anchored protein